MQVNCIWRSGLLFAALFLAIAKPKPSSSAKGCYPRGTLFQAVDTLYVKAAWLKATIPEDHIKNIRLLKKKTKKLFMKNCRFQEQLLSFFMEDVFGQLQAQVCREIHFVEELHSLRQQMNRCASHLNCDCKTWLSSWVCRHVYKSEENENLLHRICSRRSCAVNGTQSTGNIPYTSTALGATPAPISCASSAREMKAITRMKRTFYGIGNKGIYKAIRELDILLSWIKQFLESIQ